MAKTMNSQRFRFSVPDADATVLQWLDAQLNLSSSLRALIREDIQRNGFTDVTCRDVVQGAKRGRPSNAELEARMYMEEKQEKPVVQRRQESVVKSEDVPVVHQVPDVSIESEVHKIREVEIEKPKKRTQQPVIERTQVPAMITDDDGFVDPEQLLGL